MEVDVATAMARPPMTGDRPAREVAMTCCGFVDFEAAATAHWQDVMRFALHLAGNRSDADDLFQETMLKAHRAWDRLPGDAAVRPWLFRIAANSHIDDRRRRARLTPLDPVAEAHLPAPDRDPVHALHARDTLAAVEVAIAALPQKQRLALVLRKQVDATYEEIGESLGMTPVAARANVYQALKKLREQFGDDL
jgi:RNA polymerase sigma-70 factor, ECF subfamily